MNSICRVRCPARDETWQAASEALAILLVEDHDPLRVSLTDTLEQAGHGVTAVECAEAVGEVVNMADVDVAVIELDLAGEHGLSLTRRLREVYPHLGIVAVTASGAIADRYQSYASGADICLPRPMDPRELVMAVQALGARLALCRASAATGTCVIERDSHRLKTADGTLVELTQRETALLASLATAPARRLETWQLLELLGQEAEPRAKQNLEVTVSRLRSKLKAHQLPTPTLQAEHGKGYRLCLPVRIG